MDEAAAKRSAAAEARRQKILARGADRLNRITTGTPIATDASNTESPAVSTEPAQVATPSEATDASGTAGTNDLVTASDNVPDAAPLQGMGDFLEHLRQQIATVDERSSATQRDVEPTTAQLEAEMALHTLLNQLASPAAHGSTLSPAADTNAWDRSPRTGDSESTAPPRAAPVSLGPDGSGRGKGPTANSSSGHSPLLAFLTAMIAWLVGAVLGPALTAALEASRGVRCLTAVVLAAALMYGGVEFQTAVLRVPPLLLLVGTQIALIATAQLLAASPAVRTRLDKTAADDTNTPSDPSTAAPTPPAAAAGPPARFDWLSLVPGGRPLVDRLSSGWLLVSELAADVAVFLVSYLVMGAAGKVAATAGVQAGGLATCRLL